MHNNIQNINVLIEIISNEIQQGKSNLNTSVNIQKTVTYWNMGRHISDHLMFHKDNSNYGQYLIPRLSEALNIGKRTLYLSIQFYKSYKNIDSIVNYLTWSHFKILITIKSEIKRKEYEQILLEKKLTVRDLSVLIKKNNNKIVADQTNLLTIFPGKLYIYKIKNKNNKKYLDLGFNIYSDQYIDKYTDFPDNSVIEAVKHKSGFRFKNISCDSSYVFTYKAKVTKVIDGDTGRQ